MSFLLATQQNFGNQKASACSACIRETWFPRIQPGTGGSTDCCFCWSDLLRNRYSRLQAQQCIVPQLLSCRVLQGCILTIVTDAKKVSLQKVTNQLQDCGTQAWKCLVPIKITFHQNCDDILYLCINKVIFVYL